MILLFIVSFIFTIIARCYYRKTDEFVMKQDKQNVKREDFEKYLREQEIKRQEKIAKKEQEIIWEVMPQEIFCNLIFINDIINAKKALYRKIYLN